jgi:hypothetical protein
MAWSSLGVVEAIESAKTQMFAALQRHGSRPVVDLSLPMANDQWATSARASGVEIEKACTTWQGGGPVQSSGICQAASVTVKE